MAKLGADPDQLHRLAARFNVAGAQVTLIGPTIGAEIMATDWTGPDANRFRELWGEYERVLRNAGQALIDAGVKLSQQAQQQLMVSGAAPPGRVFAGPLGSHIQQMVNRGSMAGSLIGTSGAAQQLINARTADPATFHQIMSRGGPAGALGEWAGAGVGMNPMQAALAALQGTSEYGPQAGQVLASLDGSPFLGGQASDANPIASAVQRATGEGSLDWTEVGRSAEADGEFAYEWSAEGSTSGEFGGVDWDARGRVMVGASGEYAASAGMSDDGLYAQLSAGVRAGARAEGEVAGDIGFIPYEARGEAMVGGEVTAAGTATLGEDGVALDAGADAFLGARADADGRAGWENAGAGGSAGVSAGVGAHADFSGGVGWDEISFGADFGATLGIGADFGFEVSFSPSGVVDDIGDWGDGIIGDLSDLSMGDLGSSLEDAIGGLTGPADALIGGVVDMGGDAVDFVGDTVSDLNPFSW